MKGLLKKITSILLCFIAIDFHIHTILNKAMTPRMHTFRKSYLPYPHMNINAVSWQGTWKVLHWIKVSPLQDHLLRILLFWSHYKKWCYFYMNKSYYYTFPNSRLLSYIFIFSIYVQILCLHNLLVRNNISQIF